MLLQITIYRLVNTERHNMHIQCTIPVAFCHVPSPPPTELLGAASIHSSPVPRNEPLFPPPLHIEPARAPKSTAITWNVGPTHLTHEKIDKVGQLAPSSFPAIIFL